MLNIRTLQLGLAVFFSILLLPKTVFANPQQPVIIQANTNYSTGEKTVAQADKLAQQGTAVSKRQAIKKYLEVLQIYKNLQVSEASGREVRLQIATILKKIGELYQSLAEAEQALAYYNQALPIFTELGELRLQARTLRDLAMLYNLFGERQKVLDYLEAAQRLYQRIGDVGGVGLTFSNMGWIHYFFLGARQKGIELYEQALKVYQKAGDRTGESNTLSQLAWSYYGLGDSQKALDTLNQSLSIKKVTRDRYGEADALYQIARIETEQNKLTEALERIDASIKITEDLRTSVYSESLRNSFFTMRRDRYEFYIYLLMKLHKTNPSAGYDAKALHASERSRARSLLELLVEAKADLRSNANKELIEQESTIVKQINELEKRQVELLDSQSTPKQVTALETELFQLYQQYQEIKAEIKATSPNYAAIAQPQPLTLSEIQSTLLDENTLLLEYSLGEERSYLWAVTKTSIDSYELPKQADIEKAIQRFQQEELVPIRMRPAQGDLAVNTLSQILLKPVAKQLENKRLVIVADGRLQTLPFSALVIPQQSQVPLITQNEMVNLPSASTLAVLRNQVKARQVAPKTIAVLADPVFGKNDRRLRNHTDNASNGTIPSLENVPITEVELKDSLRDAGIELERLLGTRQEAEAIIALVPDTQRTQFLDFQANKASATNPDLAQYRIIHFATHGILNTVRPELSGVVMSLVDEQGTPQNGFLRLRDIFNLNLPAELVVLSACQTGQGQEVKGEGIIGLTRGFMYAGAARVLVSLWKVDDQATAELMKRFYRGMLQEKLTPAAALRQAQVEMSQIPQWSSPYYWAAFVLQGEWR